MQEVKKKPLASSEPQAFGRNALLQKRLESRCHRLHREHRTLQKQLDAASEKCITSIYSLLLEAEENEKEEKAKQKDKDVKSCIIGTIKGRHFRRIVQVHVMLVLSFFANIFEHSG